MDFPALCEIPGSHLCIHAGLAQPVTYTQGHPITYH
jgi:hypothetical protein